MKKLLLLTIIGLFTTLSFAPATMGESDTFQEGEWFRFRIHYGWFNASYATLEIKESKIDGKDYHHVVGIGKSTGALHWFFKVDDRYESHFDKKTIQPRRFIRKIDEGGHTKDIQIDFDHATGIATVNNKKHKKIETVEFTPNAQDMVSSFYYLRDKIDHRTIKKGDTYTFPMFFDKENFDFRLKMLGKETIKTKFGKIECLKFRPYVMAGRVFKEEESLTLWVSADENKIPLKIKASLAVGSLEADLDAFKGLKHSFKIVVD